MVMMQLCQFGSCYYFYFDISVFEFLLNQQLQSQGQKLPIRLHSNSDILFLLFDNLYNNLYKNMEKMNNY